MLKKCDQYGNAWRKEGENLRQIGSIATGVAVEIETMPREYWHDSAISISRRDDVRTSRLKSNMSWLKSYHWRESLALKI